MTERADFIAHLRLRQDKCREMARTQLDHADMAQAWERQLEVLIGDLEQGLHEGKAAVWAELTLRQAQGEREEVPASSSAAVGGTMTLGKEQQDGL